MNSQAEELLVLLQMKSEFERAILHEIVAKICRYQFEMENLAKNSTAPLVEQIQNSKNWFQWVGNERTKINQKIVLAIVEREEQKKILERAVGRSEVLRKMVER